VRLVLFALLLASPLAHAQVPGSPTPAGPDSTALALAADAAADTLRPVISHLIEPAAPRRSYQPQRVWTSTGAGLTTRGLGAALLVGFRLSPQTFVAPYVSTEQEFVLFTSPLESTNDVGVVYGVVEDSRFVRASVGAGLAAVIGVRRGDPLPNQPGPCGFLFCQVAYEHETFVTVGIPINAQFYVKPHRSFGFGVQVFGNVNPRASFGGFGVGMTFGG